MCFWCGIQTLYPKGNFAFPVVLPAKKPTVKDRFDELERKIEELK